MKNIEAIGIFDSRFDSRQTVIDYCNKYNVNLKYEEHSFDLNISKYTNILYKNIYNKLKNSNIEYLLIFGPYLSINYQNINPNLFTLSDFDLFFSHSILKQEAWSFFVLKKSDNLLKAIEKMLLINNNIVDFAECAEEYGKSIRSLFLSNKDIFESFNLKIIDEYNPNLISTFLVKKDLFNSFCTSFFNDSLNFESKMANLNNTNSLKIELEKNSNHYFNDICFVSIYTDDNKNYAKYSLDSIKKYCNKNLISYNFFPDSLMPGYAPNWSKAIAIFKMMQVYDTVIWIDSDCLITNFDFNLRNFCLNLKSNFTACKDPSKYYYFNSGVMIFKKSKFCLKLLENVQNNILKINDRLNIYGDGGDQRIFNISLKEMDPNAEDHSILISNILNAHPLIWKEGDFILHAMGYGLEYREKYLSYLYQKDII